MFHIVLMATGESPKDMPLNTRTGLEGGTIVHGVGLPLMDFPRIRL